MKVWVWNNQPLQLRIVVLVIAVLLAALAIFELVTWSTRPKFIGLVLFACLQLALTYGMLRMLRWARFLTVLGLWLSLGVAVIMMIGTINPFTAMDIQASGRELPPGSILLAGFAVPIAAILWCLHILGKYKGHFGQAAATRGQLASPESSESSSVH